VNNSVQGEDWVARKKKMVRSQKNDGRKRGGDASRKFIENGGEKKSYGKRETSRSEEGTRAPLNFF